MAMMAVELADEVEELAKLVEELAKPVADPVHPVWVPVEPVAQLAAWLEALCYPLVTGPG